MIKFDERIINTIPNDGNYLLIGCENSKIIKRALIINLDKLSDEEDLPHWDNFTEEEQDYILTIIQYPEILEDI